MKNFITFFQIVSVFRDNQNTIVISLYTLLLRFPLPIVHSAMVNQIRSTKFKEGFTGSCICRIFISVVVMSGMIILFLSPSTGIIASWLDCLDSNFKPDGFCICVPSYLCGQSMACRLGDSILYIATLSSVDPSLGAATMDGANKWHKIVNIDLPSLVPTATVMFILRMGSVMVLDLRRFICYKTT